MSQITKGARIAKSGAPDASDMEAINRQAIEPLTPDQVFTFRVVMCDDRVDRDFEHFTQAALAQMAALFVGKTVIKDHQHRSDNQIARIYEAHVEQAEDGHGELVAGCYMLATEANADLIAEIKGGIRREVSVSVVLEHVICDVCGTDNAVRYCEHFPGRDYGGKTCTFSLDGARDAYELSFVAVPAQRAAGVSKSYAGEAVSESDVAAAKPSDAEELSLRLRAAGAWAKSIGR
mgnify:CR=1 FL=1